jgi:hypothetical protein
MLRGKAGGLQGKLIAILAIAAACSIGGNACAMNRPADNAPCRISGADKLSAELGGAEAWCAAIRQALAPVSPKPAAIDVQVLTPHLASATVTLADGSTLPAVKVGRSDRPLGRGSMQMLANSIAAQVAERNSQ